MGTKEQTANFLSAMDEHKGLIYKVCYMYAEDSEHLRDLYQEVMANIWQGFSSYKGDSKLSTWIYRVAINTCVSYLRRDSRHRAAVSLDDAALNVVDDDFERAQQLKEMYDMIAQLGRLDKAIIMLWLDEFSYDDISSLTGISRNNVASRLHRIKHKLVNRNL